MSTHGRMALGRATVRVCPCGDPGCTKWVVSPLFDSPECSFADRATADEIAQRINAFEPPHGSKVMSKRVMHLERPNGGLMCANKPVPSRWQRTTDPEQVTCSRCQVVYRMHQRKAWTVPSAGSNPNQE